MVFGNIGLQNFPSRRGGGGGGGEGRLSPVSSRTIAFVDMNSLTLPLTYFKVTVKFSYACDEIKERHGIY